MKDPAFLFYPNDYLGGTMGMTLEEKGAYIELLILQFNRGHMTSHMVGHTVGQVWEGIKDKFTMDENGCYYNKRLETEIIKRQKYSNSRRNNLEGKNQYTKNEVKTNGHMTSHMENENENRIILDSTIIKEPKIEKKFIPPTLQEVIDYFNEKGYSKEAATKAFNFYSAGDWSDSKGSKVKNWKQKMNGVWFTDENKMKLNGTNLVNTTENWL
jgi:uncharacterized protein YdaU (DUF1376 family)